MDVIVTVDMAVVAYDTELVKLSYVYTTRRRLHPISVRERVKGIGKPSHKTGMAEKHSAKVG